MSSDSSIDLTYKLEGYIGLATDPMSQALETAMFNRFSVAGHVNLLLYQAELAQLWKQYVALEKRCSKPASLWVEFSNPEGERAAQMIIFEQIRLKLKEYHEALIAMHQVENMPIPETRYLDHLCERKAEMRPPMLGADGDFYDQGKGDLVSLRASRYQDPLSKWIAKKLVTPYDRFIGRWLQGGKDTASNLFAYSARNIEMIASITVIFMSSTILITVIFILYFLQSMTARLVSIAGFTMMYALFLTIVNNAPTMDAITATSTFAAVQVIFVSSSFSTSNATMSGRH